MKKRKRSKLEKARSKANSRHWKVKGLTLWSEIIRSGGKCVICGEDKKVLNAHHILAKEKYPEFMYLLDNGICLCQTCHKFGRKSAHLNPVWFAEWLRTNRPIQYEWALWHADKCYTPISHHHGYESLLEIKSRMSQQTTGSYATDGN
jgi:5-methylcytosine-specific restriction endonuclease McrA